MTTVVYRDGILAADRCSWSGGLRRRACKVARIARLESAPRDGEFLVGLTGDESYCNRVLRWMKGEGERPNPADYWKHDDLNRQCLLAVTRDEKFWLLTYSLDWSPLAETEFMALGAGAECAFGALEMGATAVRAVQIAASRTDYAGFGVNYVSWSSFQPALIEP